MVFYVPPRALGTTGAQRSDTMALIDVVKWDAPADQLVWKFPQQRAVHDDPGPTVAW